MAPALELASILVGLLRRTRSDISFQTVTSSITDESKSKRREDVMTVKSCSTMGYRLCHVAVRVPRITFPSNRRSK